MIDLLATEYYYLDHLSPIWRALPPECRGTVFCTSRALFRALEFANADSIKVVPDPRKGIVKTLTEAPARAVMTASFANWRVCRRAKRPAPSIPHGPGGPGQSCVTWQRVADQVELLFVASEWGKGGLEGLPVVALGGQPKVDRWLGYRPNNSHPVVALSFRWREKASAFRHYRREFSKLVKAATRRGWELLGHGHPLAFEKRFRPFYQQQRIRRTADFDKVLARADVYCVDCSSSTFEFAATGRPVVLMDCPLYDGCTFAPRFTHGHVGLHSRDVPTLIEAIATALKDPPEVRAARQAAVAEIFGPMDGKSAERAAGILVERFC